MDYKGKSTKLQPGDIAKVAESIRVPEAALRAVIDIEANGKAYTGGMPTFLFEPHRFYKEVGKDKLDVAIKRGLAYPSWKGPGSYPKTFALRWKQLQSAIDLDETAAIRSCSWGLGQIMGDEYDEAGYKSPEEMVTAFSNSEFEQLQGMANLIKHRGLDKDMRKFPDIDATSHFALRYNGKGYKKNKYHTKLQDAFNKWVQRLGTSEVPPEVDDGVLRIGDKDTVVNGPIRSVQELLKSLGYSLKIDGDFGPGTRAAVLAWQANSNRPTTGEMTPEDIKALGSSSPMPVQAERANATVNDLKPTSTIVQKTSLGKRILAWVGGITTVAAGANESGVIQQGQEYINQATQAKGLLVSAKGLLAGFVEFLQTLNDWKFPILLVAVIIGFVVMNQVQKKRLEMHQKAEIA
jgi:lysozyme family protein